MPYNKTLEEGLKEYTDRFLKKNILSDGSSTEYIHLQGTALDKDFQSFLTTFAEKIREGIVGEVEGLRINCPHDSRSHCMEEMCWVNEEGGYNQALDDLLAQLKK